MGSKPISSGLLSKVASIFRVPQGRDGSGAPGGSSENGRDAEDTRNSRLGDKEKNALQALIQRKRQDDLVRRREFNYLRKLRASPVAAGIVGREVVERPSVFQSSSGFVVDDRASTLRKIDAIEAHMVSSWARSKVASSEAGGVVPQPSRARMFESAATIAAPLRSELSRGGQRPEPPVVPDQSDDLDNLDLDFTGLLSAQGGTAVDTWTPDAADSMHQATVAMPLGRAQVPVDRGNLPPLEFTFSDMASTKSNKAQVVNAPIPLPDHIEAALQDAAIQFAEGDCGNAEAMLLGLLQDQTLTAASADVVASALFDLYRATGEQDGFDVVAMDYAERFGRSPAEWFSLPELLDVHGDVSANATSSATQLAAPGKCWECPPVLSANAVAALRAQFPGQAAAWHVDWFALAEIEPSAAPALAELLGLWRSQAVELHWSGVDSLLRAQQQQTPANDRTVDPLWWRLRLDTLCILQRHDDFESLALDYCVVFEVSPPSWQEAACTFVQDHSPSEFGTLDESPVSSFMAILSPRSGDYATCELSGDLIGEPAEALARLTVAAESADHVLVSCALLIRMDFSAAGALLNWVIDQESRGSQIQLVHVPRLIAVFFLMLGMDRHAKIVVRAN